MVEYRSGAKALKHAKTAAEIEPKANSIEALAAAYAELGEFSKAIEAQERAIALFKQEGATEKLVNALERLEGYRKQDLSAGSLEPNCDGQTQD